MNPRPVKKPPKTLLMRDAVGAGVVLVLLSFVVGNRLGDIQTHFAARSGPNAELPADLDYTNVEQVYDLLRANFDGQMDLDTLMAGLKRGLAEAAGDAHTTYLSAEESQEFMDALNGTFTGIGAELGLRDERLIIVAPIEGFPAEKAGLRARDIIAEINGEDTFGISVEAAVSKIRGPKGTDVTLTIVRGGERFDVTMTRDEITIPSVKAEVENGIGILRISRFAEDTAELARRAAEDFKAQNVRGVVLDLRNNGGGYLTGAVDIASLWLETDVVVEQKAGGRTMETLRARGETPLKGMPTIVLVNEGSASASEIVAGALQDHETAKIVGAVTFGKGSVQELEQVKSGGTLKVTIAHWFTPKGNTIEGTGIKPDIEIELSEADIKADRDRQLERAKQELK